MATKTKTKLDKLFAGLCKGNLTSDQIRSKFGLQNPSAAVDHLRNKGFDIENVVTGWRKDGTPIRKYVINGNWA